MGPTPEGPGQPEAATDVAPLPPAGWLLRFLEEPPVEPTNNRVERALRPAVLARKVSQCSETWPGAYAFAAFSSAIQALLKKGTPSAVVDTLADLFHAPRHQITTA